MTDVTAPAGPSDFDVFWKGLERLVSKFGGERAATTSDTEFPAELSVVDGTMLDAIASEVDQVMSQRFNEDAYTITVSADGTDLVLLTASAGVRVELV